MQGLKLHLLHWQLGSLLLSIREALLWSYYWQIISPQKIILFI